MLRNLFLSGILLAAGGCMTEVPPRLQVTDLASGKNFSTYATWGNENMLGYNFFDIRTGQRVMLKSYTIAPLVPGGFFKPDSSEAMTFLGDSARVNAATQGR